MWGLYGDMDGVNRSAFAQKSAAATAREAQAIQAFDSLKARIAKDGITETTTFDLLNPSVHLTDACFKAFRKHVNASLGWKVLRQEATPEEKASYKEKRKGKCYFIKVTYNPRKAGVAVADRSIAIESNPSKENSTGGRQLTLKAEAPVLKRSLDNVIDSTPEQPAAQKIAKPPAAADEKQVELTAPC